MFDDILGVVALVVMAVALFAASVRYGGLIGGFTVLARHLEGLFRAIGNTVLYGSRTPKQLRRTEVVDDCWGAHLDTLAADVEGTTLEALIEAAELRAEEAPVPRASAEPPPFQPDPDIIANPKDAQAAQAALVLPPGFTHQPIRRHPPVAGRYDQCTHDDADVEEVRTHGSQHPTRRFVVACGRCDAEAAPAECSPLQFDQPLFDHPLH